MPVTPSSNEDEHFAKLDFEKRRALAEARSHAMAAADRETLAKLHHMHCPKCGDDLVTIKMTAVALDKCPSCNGLWLDAGELEQVMERDGGGALKRVLALFK